MSAPVQSPDVLATIVAAARRSVQIRASRVTLHEMDRYAARVQPRTGAFVGALKQAGRFNVIAECKRRSPSRGILRQNYDPVAIAKRYEESGAAAISVLTEPTFFDGSLEHLMAVRNATALPLLRKDFIVDRYQILEARAAGADAILLIVSALTPDELRSLHRSGEEAGLDVLVEVHDAAELPAALDAGASIIGVNNRNLRTLAVDADVCERLVEEIPDHVVAVAESGLKTADDLRQLRDLGYDAFLIGERFMAAADPGRALEGLLCS